jgi:hypothetical protein
MDYQMAEKDTSGVNFEPTQKLLRRRSERNKRTNSFRQVPEPSIPSLHTKNNRSINLVKSNGVDARFI